MGKTLLECFPRPGEGIRCSWTLGVKYDKFWMGTLGGCVMEGDKRKETRLQLRLSFYQLLITRNPAKRAYR